MTTLRITEDDLARNVHAILEQVARGSEVIVEGADHSPLAVIRSPNRSGRPIVDVLREAKERNSTVLLGSGFGSDMEAIIAQHSPLWSRLS